MSFGRCHWSLCILWFAHCVLQSTNATLLLLRPGAPAEWTGRSCAEVQRICSRGNAVRGEMMTHMGASDFDSTCFNHRKLIWTNFLGIATWVRIKALLKQSCRTYQEMEQMKNLTLLYRLLVVLSLSFVLFAFLCCPLQWWAQFEGVCTSTLPIAWIQDQYLWCFEMNFEIEKTTGKSFFKDSLTCTDSPLSSQCTARF